MVLYNAAKRARFAELTINQNQGGGNKKAGLIPSTGVSTASRIAYINRYQPKSLKVMQFTVNPNVRQSLPSTTLSSNKPHSMTGGRMNW
jgi:hypothetical protein